MLVTGERQVAPLLRDIRADHTARYNWASRALPKGARVLDMACGVGYGTWILAAAEMRVTGADIDDESLQYAREHYPHRNAVHARIDANATGELGEYDAAVCFEAIEHIVDPRPMLRALHKAAPLLLASVPNEDVMPFGEGFAFHHRHYRRWEFAALLRECGWRVREWWGQADHLAEVERDRFGRTLVVVCERDEVMPKDSEAGKRPAPVAVDSGAGSAAAAVEWLGVPEHVAILGLGPSLERYVDLAKRLGGKHAYCDEVWGINAVGGVLMCDRLFHMDDVRVQMERAKAAPESNIARMVEWLRLHPGPVYTSCTHADFPGLVAYPLGDVIRKFDFAYFNSTASYAIAYAVYLGVKKISLFGVDFTYPNAHQAEKGRGCVEFWLGIASQHGVKLSIPKESTLMDALHTDAERLYGYDCCDVRIKQVDGKLDVTITDHGVVPNAAAVEAKYDHSQHPNALVSGR